ncbi:MAG TPA: hypothetical protein VGZ02_15340 [Candidatus Baltobacteraceae bacterium]|jgi:hypothetical protein|nr:hypothetical protein [Candidatus Baltobacteraceae bacterium]
MRSFIMACRAAAAAAIAVSLTACGSGTATPPAAQTEQSVAHSAGYRHTPPRPPAPRVFITDADRAAAAAAGWTAVAGTAPFGTNGAGTPLLLTDGTILIGDNTSNYYKLTPNAFGNYAKGTWSQVASLPSGYGPLYFASAVRADGTVLVEGGEYNFFSQTETNLGALYDPVANTWTPVTPPNNWTQIGDAQSAVLNDGTFMLGNCCKYTQALSAPGGTSWTSAGSGKADANSEEGWTLLPNAQVLTADVLNAPNSELYNPATKTWTSAGKIPVKLTQSDEIGPQILRPDGTVFVAGANGHTAIYNSKTSAWAAGPNFPIVNGAQVDIADGPATLLTNGRVLMVTSPGVYQSPSYYYIFTGTGFTAVPGPPNAPNDSSYNVRLLLLPTGQVLETDGSNDVEIYTPGVKPSTNIAPVISSVPSTLTHGTTYSISGQRFNGFSQANAYGDDAQMATNYPLVQITMTASKHVYYARTHGHSFMGVASQATVSTNFDVPASIETGAATLVVIANGIKSAPTSVTID